MLAAAEHLLDEADQYPTPPCSVLGPSPITTHHTIEPTKKATYLVHLFFLGSPGREADQQHLLSPPPITAHHNRADERLSVSWRRTGPVTADQVNAQMQDMPYRSRRGGGGVQMCKGVQAVQLPKRAMANSITLSLTAQQAVAGPSLPR